MTSYTNILSDFRADSTLLSADQGSTLNLSNVTTFSMQDSYGHSGSWNYYVTAKNNSTIDLSKVTSVVGAGQDEWLHFRMESGGNINLAKLSASTGRVWYDVAEQGTLRLGNLAVSNNARFELRHISSKVEVTGSFFLNGTSEFLMADGAQADVAGDFLFQYTDEARMQFDRGRLHLNGSGLQYLEAGGVDGGLAGAAASNFGIGRLEIGSVGAPTTVQVLDLFNNGNRGVLGQEALYLGGIAGLDGLVINPGSMLVLNDVNIYARINGVMTLLNSLIPAGATAMQLGAGFLALHPTLPGDFNFDNRVDQADYDTWKSSFGSTSNLAADGNHNGVIDAADYSIWRDNRGQTLAAATSTQTAVPEPATIYATLAIVMICIAHQRMWQATTSSKHISR